MAYSLKAEIQKEISDDELIGLTDDVGAGTMDDAKITAAIARADAMIDSYCGQVAEVPFTTVPAIIKQHSITIAIYFLFTRRSVAPEVRRDNYKDAIKHLQDIATGKAALPPTTEGDVAEQVASSHTEEDRKITMGKSSDGSSGTLDNY